jgi:peptidoglycan hydrolase-like protein with peptidoglycan-binding domain
MQKTLTCITCLVLSLILSHPTLTTAQDSLSSPACIRLDNDLRYRYGQRDQVFQLQNFLRFNGYLTANATGYFGPQTLAAVKKFQVKSGIPATGFVGSLTRGKINALTQCPDSGAHISNIAGPEMLNVNEKGTWEIKVEHVKGVFEYKVRWGDELETYNASISSPIAPPPPSQQTTFTHTFNKAGTYPVTFYVLDTTTGIWSIKSKQVKVTDPNQPHITVTSPNGNEQWTINSVKNITWNMTNNTDAQAKVDLYLDYDEWAYMCPTDMVCPMLSTVPVRTSFVLDKNIAGNMAYSWIVGTDINDVHIPRGQYKVRICQAGSATNCDTSNSAFTLVDVSYENNQPPVTRGLTGPTVLKVGQSGTWIVDAYDPEGESLSYQASWHQINPAVGDNPNAVLRGTWQASVTNSFQTKFDVVGDYLIEFSIYDRTGKGTEVKWTVKVER